jgi:hypothetical protein
MVMLITMVALVLLLIGVAAAIRTIDTSGILVGNLAFRRDLTNRSETAIATARAALVTGAISTDTVRAADLASSNYSAVRLATGANGVPTVLLSDSAYTAAGYSQIDGTAANGYVTLRWVIDRQCVVTGAFNSATSTGTCETVANVGGDAGGSGQMMGRKPSGSTRPIYRISVRVSGPRSTEAYFQTTYVD